MTKTILLSKNEMATLKAKTSAWSPLVAVCDSELDYEVQPLNVINTVSSYTDTGHDQNQVSDRLSIPASIAYRASLCYQLTGDVKYATNAQRIIDAWSKTLRRIEGAEAQSIIGFHWLYLVVAGDWTRGVNGWDGVEFGNYLNDTIIKQSRIHYQKNISSWWSALTAGIHAYNDNYEGLLSVVDDWKRQVNEQVCDGTADVCNASYALDMSATTKLWTLPEELTRSAEGGSNFNSGATKGQKGLDYTHFGMRPWTLCMEILLKEGINVYETDEAGKLQNVFNKLVGWVIAPVYSPYYARNKGNLSNVDKVDYFAPLTMRFKPRAGIETEDTNAITSARNVLDYGILGQPITGDRWQLDLLFRGNYNPPAG
ncbi:alginate lyase [Caudoviricetes sp.]|nr:alginate lyase [Caudoviricetes sp.]